MTREGLIAVEMLDAVTRGARYRFAGVVDWGQGCGSIDQ